MATINAIGSNKPIEVAFGGTGNATLTNHGVLVGATTSAITQLAVGSTGTLLVGASAADPAFGTSANGDFTFTSSTAGATRTLTTSNTDNTNASSKALEQITTGGGSSGDPAKSYTISGAATFTEGLDNSASDSYKISASASLGTTDTFIMTTDGERTLPLTPAFLGWMNTANPNQTGAGATSTMGTVVATLEVFDQANNYVTSGTFTAPITGRYLMHTSSRWSTGVVAATNIVHSLVTSNRTYMCSMGRIASDKALGRTFSVLADFDVGDTAVSTSVITGEAGNIDGTSAGGSGTYMAGHLVC